MFCAFVPFIPSPNLSQRERRKNPSPFGRGWVREIRT